MVVRRLIELPVISYRQTGCPVRVGGELKDHPGYVGCSGLLLVSRRPKLDPDHLVHSLKKSNLSLIGYGQNTQTYVQSERDRFWQNTERQPWQRQKKFISIFRWRIGHTPRNPERFL